LVIGCWLLVVDLVVYH